MTDIAWITTVVLLVVVSVVVWFVTALRLLVGRRRVIRLGFDARIAGTAGASGALALLLAAITGGLLSAEFVRAASTATSPAFLILAVITSVLSLAWSYMYAGISRGVLERLDEASAITR